MGLRELQPPEPPERDDGVRVRFVTPEPRERPAPKEPAPATRLVPSLNHLGPYELRRLGMNIQEVNIPKQERQSKYDYTESLDLCRQMLKDGKQVGDGPFKSQGAARSAANALLGQLKDDVRGARTWEKKDGPQNTRGWYFGLTDKKVQKTRKNSGNAASGNSGS